MIGSKWSKKPRTFAREQLILVGKLLTECHQNTQICKQN